MLVAMSQTCNVPRPLPDMSIVKSPEVTMMLSVAHVDRNDAGAGCSGISEKASSKICEGEELGESEDASEHGEE